MIELERACSESQAEAEADRPLSTDCMGLGSRVTVFVRSYVPVSYIACVAMHCQSRNAVERRRRARDGRNLFSKSKRSGGRWWHQAPTIDMCVYVMPGTTALVVIPHGPWHWEEIHTGQEGRAEKVHCLQSSVPFIIANCPGRMGAGGMPAALNSIRHQRAPMRRLRNWNQEPTTYKCVPVSEGSWPASVRVPIVTLRMEILQWSMADERYEQC